MRDGQIISIMEYEKTKDASLFIIGQAKELARAKGIEPASLVLKFRKVRGSFRPWRASVYAIKGYEYLGEVG